jgi:ribose transport system substrate-binding protein
MDCGEGSCVTYAAQLKIAAKLTGVTLEDVPTGKTAASASAAFSTVVQQKPNVVLSAGPNPAYYSAELKGLAKEKIPVVATGTIDGVQNWGFAASLSEAPQSTRAGDLLADYVYIHYGEQSNVVMYTAPELTFTAPEAPAFTKTLKSLCPKCVVRIVPISATTWGTTAPSMVVSDLQANPNTNVVVAATSSMWGGVPAAMAEAGLHVPLVGYPGVDPVSLQYLKDGQVQGVLAQDIVDNAWQLMDVGLRAVEHAPLPKSLYEYCAIEFLSKKNVTFNPANGWVPFPNYQKRWAGLWLIGKKS